MEAPNQLNLLPLSEKHSKDLIFTAGLDEAGRGCLAGPVVAVAVILDPASPIKGLADSKKLSVAKRESLATEIRIHALAWAPGFCWQRRIDEINILQATFEAMARAIRALKIQARYLLIDGPHCIPANALLNIAGYQPEQNAIVAGDNHIPAISAASILAKTIRDRLMCSLGRRWPAYGFERHKGYGTKSHLEALRKFGPCPLHRLTFNKVCEKRARFGSLNLP